MINTESHRNSIVALIKEILSIFYQNRKIQFYLLLLIIFLSSIADVASFSLIIPVIYIINDPLPIHNVDILHFFYQYFQFDSVGTFVLFLLLGLVFVFLVKNLFLIFSTYFQNRFIYSVSKDILEKQLGDFYKTDYLDVKENNTMGYLRCFLEVPRGVADSLLMPLIFILNELLVIIFILLALVFYKPSVVALLFVTIVPIGYLLIYIAKRKLQENSDKRTTLEKETYIISIEGLNAYRDIKLFNKEKKIIHSILSVFNSFYDVLIAKNVYMVLPRRIIEVLVVVTICVLYVITNFSLNTSRNQMLLTLLAFSTAAYRMLPSLNEVVTNVVKIRTSVYLLDLLRFIKEPDASAKSDMHPLLFNRSIELRGINFRYKENNEAVLNSLSLTIKKGEFIILTGDSGSGKTTIGKILTGFIKPDSGKYLIDHSEVQHINQIKKQIGYVTQDFYLFDKTLLENIALGDSHENIDFGKIERVLEYTNLKEFVASLPLGIYQPIGEMGAKVSGGQKQRIAIARAMYKEIEFLVLDEATSSLDNSNEQEVIKTIYEISKKTNMTVLLITHRIASVRNYDAIYELSDGLLRKIS